MQVNKLTVILVSVHGLLQEFVSHLDVVMDFKILVKFVESQAFQHLLHVAIQRFLGDHFQILVIQFLVFPVNGILLQYVLLLAVQMVLLIPVKYVMELIYQ